MNADCVLDRVRLTVPGMKKSASPDESGIEEDSLSNKRGIKVLDRSLAVATHSKRVSHITRTVLTEIKGVFAVVRMVGVAIRHDHLSKRNAPEHLYICQKWSLEVFVGKGQDDSQVSHSRGR